MANLTLVDYLHDAKPLVQGVIKIMMEESPFLTRLPMVDVGTLSVEVLREGALPPVAWRKIGSAHSSSKGTKPDRVTEQAYSVGNYIDIDIAYLRDKAPKLYDPKAAWIDATSRAISRDVADAIINGVPTSTPDKPTGLWYRLKNELPAAQTISTGGLDLTGALSSDEIHSLFDYFDKAIYQCADHKADAILCNSDFIMRYNSAARQSGLLDVTKDAIGREFTSYKGIPFLDMGYKVNDSDKIIGNAEAADGSALTGSSYTSVYFVRFGSEYFTGWQEYPLDVREIGMLEDGVTERTVIDWIMGIAVAHPRSITRIVGLKVV